jgi:hypothetical protein
MDTLLTSVGTDLMNIMFLDKGTQLQPRQALTRLTQTGMQTHEPHIT